MNIIRNVPEKVILIAIGFCLTGLPANADTEITIESTSSPVKTTTQVIEQVVTPAPTVTLTRTIVKETTISPDLYLVTIDTRRHELEKIIGEGMATGKLTQAQADDLRAELDFVTQQELIARKLGAAVPYSQIAVMAARLDVLGLRLREIVGITYAPIIVNGTFIVSNGEVVQLDVIAVRRAELEGKISLALAHNSLSGAQVNELRAQLDAIAVMEVQFRGSGINGEFTDQQAREMFVAFDRVGSKLDRFISSNHGKPVTGVY